MDHGVELETAAEQRVRVARRRDGTQVDWACPGGRQAATEAGGSVVVVGGPGVRAGTMLSLDGSQENKTCGGGQASSEQ